MCGPLTMRMTVLPEYEAPPVVEMSMAVHFETLTELRSGHIGMFAEHLGATQDDFQWSSLEEDFPRPVVIEQFKSGPLRPPFRLQIVEELPPPRTTLSDEARHRSLAVQQDAFEYTWWKDSAEGVYPRHSVLRAEFLPLLERFREFLAHRRLGAIRIRQVEIVYRNGLQRGHDWPEDGTAAQVLRSWASATDAGLPPIEDAHFGQTHVVSDGVRIPGARLYISLDTNVAPLFPRGAETDWAWLSLTFRGVAGPSADTEEVKLLLSRGREAIVQAFTAVTTDDAHARWRRTR